MSYEITQEPGYLFPLLLFQILNATRHGPEELFSWDDGCPLRYTL